MTISLFYLYLTRNDQVNSRRLIQTMVACLGIPDNLFAEVCVIIDKMEKVKREELEQELHAVGVPPEKATRLITLVQVESIMSIIELSIIYNDA